MFFCLDGEVPITLDIPAGRQGASGAPTCRSPGNGITIPSPRNWSLTKRPGGRSLFLGRGVRGRLMRSRDTKANRGQHVEGEDDDKPGQRAPWAIDNPLSLFMG